MYLFIYFISLRVSSITVLIIRRSNCINTSSGMISLCECLVCRSWPAYQAVTYTNCFLVTGQRDAQILFYVFISIYNSLHVSSTSCSSSGETNCINAASGNSLLCWWPRCMQVGRRLLPTYKHLGHQHRRLLPEAVLIKFVSPDDEHDVLETCRELYIEINA